VAEGLRDHGGGIRGLSDELERHGEAIEHDLVMAGWTLDDVPERLNWRAFAAFVRHRAVDTTSALHRHLAGDDYHWGLREQLLAAVVDELRVANWQRAASGAKKGKQPPRPKPIPRPGIGRRNPKSTMPLSEFQQIIRRHNPDAFTSTDREG